MMGISACEIAFVKKEGSIKRGRTYPFMIPYSIMISFLAYPNFKRIVVKIIGSKKYVMDPIRRDKVVGIEILKIALIFSL